MGSGTRPNRIPSMYLLLARPKRLRSPYRRHQARHPASQLLPLFLPSLDLKSRDPLRAVPDHRSTRSGGRGLLLQLFSLSSSRLRPAAQRRIQRLQQRRVPMPHQQPPWPQQPPLPRPRLQLQLPRLQLRHLELPRLQVPPLRLADKLREHLSRWERARSPGVRILQLGCMT